MKIQLRRRGRRVRETESKRNNGQEKKERERNIV